MLTKRTAYDKMNSKKRNKKRKGKKDMKIGYVRVSTVQQHTDRQDLLMEKLCVEKIFVDKESGAKRERPALKAMEGYVREGDVLVVESISRLARSTRDFLSIVDCLNSKGVELVVQKENIDTSTPQGKFMLTVFAALSELEREQTLQRTKEGIEAAKLRGAKFGRPKKGYDKKKFEELYEKYKEREITSAEFAQRLGIGRTLLYKIINEYNK